MLAGRSWPRPMLQRCRRCRLNFTSTFRLRLTTVHSSSISCASQIRHRCCARCRQTSGVIKGNLGATIVLLIIIALSFVLVVLTIALPALPSRLSGRVAPADRRGARSIFAHRFRVHGVRRDRRNSAAVAFSRASRVRSSRSACSPSFLSTGVGSLISDCIPLSVSPPRHAVGAGRSAMCYLGALPFWLPLFVGVFLKRAQS